MFSGPMVVLSGDRALRRAEITGWLEAL